MLIRDQISLAFLRGASLRPFRFGCPFILKGYVQFARSNRHHLQLACPGDQIRRSRPAPTACIFQSALHAHRDLEAVDLFPIEPG